MRMIQTKSYEEMSMITASLIGAQVLLKPTSVLGLATGSSPIGTYRYLIENYKKGILDFSGVRTVNLDEYCGLAGEHPQSYRYFMNTTLFDHINIQKENTYVPNGAAVDYDAECARYEALVQSMGGVDMQLLGIGHNGHIAFNEPDTHFPAHVHRVNLTQSTIDANSRLFDDVNQVPKTALTMGIGTIMRAKKIVLIAGPEKTEIINCAMHGKISPDVPASVLQMHPDVTVVVSR